MNILIAYASRHGQTAKIAAAIAQRIRELGHTDHLVDLARDGEPASLFGYDAVVLGSPLHAGSYDRRVVRLATTRRAQLERLPAAFFGVSLSAAHAEPKRRAPAEACIDAFIARTGWRPALRASLAGGLPYTRYGFIMRFIMKRMSKANGGDTDTTRDHEYTDWHAVTSFADELVALAASGAHDGTRREVGVGPRDLTA